ncbi:hypothetical protein BABINDRAFT_37342 [Babjeviella inositovora NRRL Y-12698]|uniref:E3 ubiquitin protein ligase n=1 Tax=Babjeviella inositovora NRRL Y-12698 TaxID=984486 RepID=A0A1E3QNT5_9ASCO|nr:uncharacterized protein BABINDRAFT_37342 [Babjeviella inositovora NRRL Y-12698]ODQ79369.1 hypothetical protein BABINDRAFT_37342 [Babjeviella inositovora NRRL Y-12698]
MSLEENKKRIAESATDDSPKRRRRALDELSEEGPLTQKDVIYFQKEAIWRQMNHYKQKSVQLNDRVNRYAKQCKVNEARAAILNAWYDELVLLLKAKVGTVSDVNQDLLADLPEGDEEANEVLQQRRSQLLELLTPVLLSHSGLSNSMMEKKLEVLIKDLSTLKAQKLSVAKENELLNGTITKLNQDLEDLIKHQERLSSKTLNRISESHGRDSESTQSDANGSKPDTSKPDASKPAQTINNEELEQLTIQLNEHKALNTSLQKQLNDQLSSITAITNENKQLQLKIADPSDDDITKTGIFQTLQKQVAVTSAASVETRDINESLIKEIQGLESERSKFRTDLRAVMEKELREMKESMGKSDTDLTRIRTIRDDLLAQIAILKANKTNKEVMEGYNTVIEAQKTRIAELEANPNVYRKELLQKLDPVDESVTRELLILKNNLLVAELKELEVAFKNVHSLSLKKIASLADADSMVNKLNVEKSKADQKYFSAMRAKDALSSENKTLKQQISATRDFITQLKEIEKAHLLKIELLEATNKDLKATYRNSVEDAIAKDHKLTASHAKTSELAAKYKDLQIRQLAEGDKSIRELQLKNELENEAAKLKSKVSSLESLLSKYKAHVSNSASGIPFDEDQKTVEALRALAKCSVCSKNWKDTAITVCGHVFCSECADDRIKSRMRKCPSCNKQFSVNDLLTIHL